MRGIEKTGTPEPVPVWFRGGGKLLNVGHEDGKIRRHWEETKKSWRERNW